MSRWYLTETEYPAVRRVMGRERERLDDDALENLLERMFPGAEPEYVEDFMQTLQQFGQQAAPILQKVGPGMAQGAIQGSALGPYGALFGALAGGASGLLSGGGPGAAPARGPTPGAPVAQAVMPVAAQMTPGVPGAVPVGAQAPATGASGAATAQLLALLSRPETMQALIAMVMAQHGRSTVPVGQHQVPAAAFANAISELAAEAALSSSGPAGYWYDPHGAPRCDVANPSARAALLWTDLSAAAAAESDEWAADGSRWLEVGESLDDNGALESFEAALAGEHPDDY